MSYSFFTEIYLNNVLSLTRDKELLDFLEKSSRNQIWMIINDADFDNFLLQRIYEPAQNSIKHFEEGCYQSSIILCGAVGEMLTYFLFFVHTNSDKILDGNSDISHSRYSRITQSKLFTPKKIKQAFGEKGNQKNRIEILKKAKITKADYGKSGKGHDIGKICNNLDYLHEIRRRYSHHWFYEEEGQMTKNNARKCITFLYEAIGDIFEYDISINEPGALSINRSIFDWIINQAMIRQNAKTQLSKPESKY